MLRFPFYLSLSKFGKVPIWGKTLREIECLGRTRLETRNSPKDFANDQRPGPQVPPSKSGAG